MEYLKVKEIIMKEDKRNSNILEKDSKGKPIKFKQSKCTCNIIFLDQNNNEYLWVAKNKDLAEAIELIAKSEDKKYPYGLGRNLFFLSWLYQIYEKYLTRHGFNPPKEDLEKGEKFKNANKD